MVAKDPFCSYVLMSELVWKIAEEVFWLRANQAEFQSSKIVKIKLQSRVFEK
jgi:hypothetical protein